jgi:hypothetical protein
MAIESRFKNKPKTLEYYKNGIKNLTGFAPLANSTLDMITNGKIAAFVTKRREAGLQVTSINRQLEVLRRMQKLATEWGKVNRVLPKVEMLPGENHRDRVLTADEEERYLEGTAAVGTAIQQAYVSALVRPKEKPDPIILMHDPSASAGIIVKDLGIARTLKLQYMEKAKADNSTLSVTFKFADGRYPVQYQAVLTKPVAASNLEYHDDALAITFSLQKTEIDFVLQNNSNDPIKVDWNLVSFVQSWGTSQGVIHKGVKLVDKQAVKAPSMIPPKAKIEDMIVPVENVELVAGDWLTHALLAEGPAALQLVGQEFSIFMPLEIGGTTKNYTFTFKIVRVD